VPAALPIPASQRLTTCEDALTAKRIITGLGTAAQSRLGVIAFRITNKHSWLQPNLTQQPHNYIPPISILLHRRLPPSRIPPAPAATCEHGLQPKRFAACQLWHRSRSGTGPAHAQMLPCRLPVSACITPPGWKQQMLRSQQWFMRVPSQQAAAAAAAPRDTLASGRADQCSSGNGVLKVSLGRTGRRQVAAGSTVQLCGPRSGHCDRVSRSAQPATPVLQPLRVWRQARLCWHLKAGVQAIAPGIEGSAARLASARLRRRTARRALRPAWFGAWRRNVSAPELFAVIVSLTVCPGGNDEGAQVPGAPAALA
jgi:hypothetical protein